MKHLWAVVFGLLITQQTFAQDFLVLKWAKEHNRKHIARIELPAIHVLASGSSAGHHYNLFVIPSRHAEAEAKILKIINNLPRHARNGEEVTSLYGQLTGRVYANEVMDLPRTIERTNAINQLIESSATIADISLVEVSTFFESGTYVDGTVVKQDRCISYEGHVLEILVKTKKGSHPFYFTSGMLKHTLFELDQETCQNQRAKVLSEGFSKTRI